MEQASGAASVSEFRPFRYEIKRAKWLAAECERAIKLADLWPDTEAWRLGFAKQQSSSAFALSKLIATRSKDPK